MRKHLRQLAKPPLVLLGLLMLAIAAVLVAAAGPVVTRAEVLALPPVPHTLQGREQCLLCHAPNGAKPVPADHAGRTDATCQGCHQAAPAPEAPPAQSGAATPAIQPAPKPSSDAACIACHQAPLVVKLSGGETITATVDAKELGASVHGKNISCTACHADKTTGYPHAKITAADRRAYTATMAKQCEGCHKEVAAALEKSVHGQAAAAGNVKAATCVDCHGAHNVGDASRLARRPQLCAACHSTVTDTYRESVHGQLVSQGRVDAATCLDCHTAKRSGHTIDALDDPLGATADKNVPDTCGQCHKQALETYNSTFHGRAMRLGVKGTAPSCVDCHGAYGVQRVHGTDASIDEARFANACAKCHEGADESFTKGWMGHEEPSPSWFPAVFITERLLFFLMTSAVAFGIVHVELDLLRWLVRRRKDGNGREGK